MFNYITIDGGTTNTRISLVVKNDVVDTVKSHIGARNGIDGKEEYKQTLKNSINEILERNNLKETDIHRILASGMITSEYGLYELKHTVAPAGIEQLHNNMAEVLFEDISAIPFVFISGLKLKCDTLENADIMRGEETEIIGLAEKYGTEAVYVLPGSHAKIIEFDNENRICNFTTVMSGEMISAVANNTILKGCVDLNTQEFDAEHLLLGYDFAQKYGLTQALFKARILKNVFNKNSVQVYSYFLGAILCNDISAILNCNCNTVVLGGKSCLKDALAEILNSKTEKQVVCASEEDVEHCVAQGAVKIYEYLK